MNRIARNAIVFGGLVTLLAYGGAWAQNGEISLDRVGGLISGTTVQSGQPVRFVFRLRNTTGERVDIGNGFKVSTPDGAVWDSTTIATVANFPFAFYFNSANALVTYSANGIAEDTAGLFGAGDPGDPTRQLPSTFNDTAVAVTAWFSNTSAGGKHICVDSAFLPPSVTWTWVGGAPNFFEYRPTYSGLSGQPYSNGLPGSRLGSGFCFEIYAPTLGVSPNLLTYSAIAGASNPPNQTFQVTSSGDGMGDHLNYTLTETSPWIVATPLTASTPRTITVSINTVGLLPGVYIDSIKVESAGALGSPKYVRIQLTVSPPPPTIFLSTNSMVFSGVTGQPNPPSQTFIVKNVGASQLNWSLSHTKSWLSLSPMSGVDSNEVTVSVDLTGVPFGNNFDTIVVSDPTATNNPQKIEVKLQVISSLPVIAADSSYYTVICDLSGSLLLPPIHTLIYNGGGGDLTFTVSENNPRLLTLTPTSGTAPQDIEVKLKIVGQPNHTEHYDTMWVTSPEAVNSPFPVVFRFHYTNGPNIIAPTKDTLKFTMYPCQQGQGVPEPRDTLRVFNDGLDNPLNMTVQYESPLFSVNPLSGTAPATFMVTPTRPALPYGIYYDTITLLSDLAINSPKHVIVRFEWTGTVPPPIIALNRDTVSLPRQEGTGLFPMNLKIRNVNPGCMPWTSSEAVPWLTPTEGSGEITDPFLGIIDITGQSFGLHNDSMYIESSSASNSPKKVILQLKIWRLHGDWNWDGRISLVDLSMMVAYFKTGLPLPQPEMAVGDLNCDNAVALADLSMMVTYLKLSAPIPCGNPF